MAETNPLEFIILYEKNYKEDELFIFYLQWTGNEEDLTKLNTITSKADYKELYGSDYSYICLDINVKIPESAVDVHCKVSDPNSYNKLFTKCAGNFRYPFYEEDMDMDEYELASLINSTFCSCGVKRMFKRSI